MDSIAIYNSNKEMVKYNIHLSSILALPSMMLAPENVFRETYIEKRKLFISLPVTVNWTSTMLMDQIRIKSAFKL